MHTMNKGILNLIIFILLVLPWVVHFCCIPSELKTNQYLFTIIGLFLSYYTLLATIGIALYIYYLQTNAERNKSRSLQTQVKEAIANEIENIWFNVVFNEKPNQSITNEKLKKLFMDYSLELKESLKYEEYQLLNQIVNLLLAEASRYEYSFVFRPWLRDVLKSDYWYLLHRAADFAQLYDKRVFLLINAFHGSPSRYQEEVDSIFDKDKNMLFMRDSEGISIYKDRKLLAKGVFGFDRYNNFKILNGYSTSKVYVGFVKNGLREGNGKWYRGEYTMEEGQFKAGKLIDGIKHNWVLRKYKGRQYIKFPLDSDDAKHLYINTMMHPMFLEKGSYHVVDIEVKNGKEKYVNYRYFKQYCEDNDVF